jgi:hypothetical protein
MGSAVALAALAWGSAATAQAGPAAAIVGGRPLLELRARYESVDQAGLAREAQAATLRTRLGWETGAWRGLRVLAEVEDVRRLAPERYNVAVPGVAGASLNGRTAYPIVNDPQGFELNRAQLAWTARPGLSFTAGRQRIVLDDQRFVGAVGWRQDEQTFDAVRADLGKGRLRATYAYVTRVNRVFAEALDWRSDSHIANVSYAVGKSLTLQGAIYALDFSNAPASATLTWSAKASGRSKVGEVALTYDLTWARQGDYRGNSAPFALDYWSGDLAATRGPVTARAAFEVLEGDGARGFVTPLATAHAFNGWSDTFAAVGGNKTFPDGIRDLNLQLVVRAGKRLGGGELLVRYHDFDAQRTGADLGHEWDAQFALPLTKHLSTAVKYADFRRVRLAAPGTAAPPASRSKLWLTLEYRL